MGRSLRRRQSLTARAADEVLARGGDLLDDEERAALHAELEASIAEADAGELIDAEVVLAELRKRH